MALMMGVMVLFWGAVIFGIVWLIRASQAAVQRLRGDARQQETAVQILERRFAEGALTPGGLPRAPRGARQPDSRTERRPQGQAAGDLYAGGARP